MERSLSSQGGNSRIGPATAKVFVTEGARVYITGRRKAELQAAATFLGARATPVQGDVSKPADLDRLYDRIRTDAGQLHVIFANAGFGVLAPLGGLTEEDCPEIGGRNVSGFLRLPRRAGMPGQLQAFQETCPPYPPMSGHSRPRRRLRH